MEKVTLAALFLLLSSASSLDLFPGAAFVPFFAQSVLGLDNRVGSGHNDAIFFPESSEMFSQLESQRRTQLLNENKQDSVTVTKAQSFQLPTQQSQILLGQNIQRPFGNVDRVQTELTETTRSTTSDVNLNPTPTVPTVRPIQNQFYQNQFLTNPNFAFVSPSLNRPIQATITQNQASTFGQSLSQNGQTPGDPNKTLVQGQGSKEDPIQGNTDAQIPVQRVDPVSTSVTGFGLDIMKNLDATTSGNAVISPYSIALVLALLQQGTEGEAQLQITRALRMNPLQSREIFKQLNTNIKGRYSRNILKIATSIFFNNDFEINRQYKTDALHFFSSEMTSVNFNNAQGAARLINSWVSAGTQGNIPYLVTPDMFSDDTQMVLANAVYFKGLWNQTFNLERTVSRPFHLPGGGVTPANFMHLTGSFRAGRDIGLNADFLVMPFEGLQYSMIALVPSEQSDVGSLLRRLTHGDLTRFLKSPARDVVISLPKFNIRVDSDLYRPLVSLGIQRVFSEKSGLSALGNARGGHPRVTGSIHTAILSIDEQGGSAAATTLLAVSTLSLDFYDLEFRFNADRPFVAILWDNEVNVPLFLAKIVNPMSEK